MNRKVAGVAKGMFPKKTSERSIVPTLLDMGRKGKDTVSSHGGVKRYNLVLPIDLFNAIQDIANEQHTSVVDILKRFITLGLIAYDAQKDPNAKLILKEGGREQEIALV